MNLVTGATGHIGNVLVRLLLERGENVRAMIMPGEDSTPLQGLDVELVEGDVQLPLPLESQAEHAIAFRGFGIGFLLTLFRHQEALGG